jgi:protein-disulfide isomerase
MAFSRRHIAIAAALVASLGLAACNNGGGAAGGGSPYELATDLPMGSKDAKVVLVEYASITCPHCANFHNNVLPTIKEKYVDTGKVRYVFREFPTAPVVIASAGHLLRRCVAADKRDGVLDALMRGQQEIFVAAQGPGGVKPAMLQIAAAAGMNEQEFDACMNNRELLKVLADVRQSGIDAGVQGTPALFINGEPFAAPAGREIEAKDLEPVLDAALAKAG